MRAFLPPSSSSTLRVANRRLSTAPSAPTLIDGATEEEFSKSIEHINEVGVTQKKKDLVYVSLYCACPSGDRAYRKTYHLTIPTKRVPSFLGNTNLMCLLLLAPSMRVAVPRPAFGSAAAAASAIRSFSAWRFLGCKFSKKLARGVLLGRRRT